jgi:hypothetical protein
MKDPDLGECISESTLQAVDTLLPVPSGPRITTIIGECACGRYLSLKSEKLNNEVE